MYILIKDIAGCILYIVPANDIAAYQRAMVALLDDIGEGKLSLNITISRETPRPIGGN